ncbi:MAG: hypothetical protein ABIJ95_04570, partial [Pseudomonadota bacterium]
MALFSSVFGNLPDPQGRWGCNKSGNHSCRHPGEACPNENGERGVFSVRYKDPGFRASCMTIKEKSKKPKKEIPP